MLSWMAQRVRTTSQAFCASATSGEIFLAIQSKKYWAWILSGSLNPILGMVMLPSRDISTRIPLDGTVVDLELPPVR